MRPLRVEELAEVLAFEMDTAEGELPRYHPDWRWEDQENAVLSACSSLITIVNSNDSRVIQFSHFSVKEYLTSKRLSTASVVISRYHIALEPAHLVLARACLGSLLHLDTCANTEHDKPESSDENGSEESNILRKYAAEYWTSHAEVGDVASCLKDAMETLFDPNKPFFAAWRQIHDPNTYHHFKQSHLYYAARHGFYDLVQYLIDRHPEQVTHHDVTYMSPLVAALESGKHVRVADLLLKHGARVHIRKDPPLCCVIREHHLNDGCAHAVRFLLEHGAQLNAGEQTRMTPLHRASYVGHPEVVRILLEHGADPALQNTSGNVPLHFVSERCHRDENERLIVARLLLRGRYADVNAQDSEGSTPLHFATYNRRPKIIQLLLAHGASAHIEDDRGRNPLHEMSPFHKEGDRDDALRCIQLLLEQGVDVNVRDRNHETPLHIASSNGSLEITQLLLEHGAKANAENFHGQTPLHLVSHGQNVNENSNVTRLLLQLGMDVNARDKHLATPLHFATSNGHLETALALLDHGADVNAQNADGKIPLHLLGVSLGTYEDTCHSLARLMLERGADVNARDKNQATPLHSVSYIPRLEPARVLLDHGANIHAKNAQGQTPLHSVSQHVNKFPSLSETALVELLLSRGADLNARDNDQATPFLLLSPIWNPRTTEILIKKGADVNVVNILGQNAWHCVSQNPHLDRWWCGSLFKLLRGVDMSGRDNDERTPLHLASYYGQVEVAEALLEHTVQVNATDIWGHTPLHQVTLGIANYDYKSSITDRRDQRRHPGRVIRLSQLLLEHGADVNAQNKDHDTPLHLASSLRLHEMARLLLKHGAKVDLENLEGKTPLQVATRRKGKVMRRLLSEYFTKEA